MLLTGLATGLFYVRILYGPISLRFLAEPIASSIAAELPGHGVSVEDALVRLNEEGQLEFRLRNVRVLDEEGSSVAIAPLAAVELSLDALLMARVSPAKIVLIEPRILLSYAEDTGLSLSFARPSGPEQAEQASALGANPSAQAAEVLVRDGDAGVPVGLRRLDLARTIAETTARARAGSDAASYLRELGLRNAALVLEHAKGKIAWRVPRADIALSHRKARSLIEGDITVASGGAPWRLHFWTEASEAKQQVALKASIHDLVPSSIAGLPGFKAMRALDVPASGQVSLHLTSAGEVIGGSFSLELAKGVLRPPWLPGAPLDIERGRLDLRYDPGSRLLRVARSTLEWGHGRLAVEGQVVGTTDPDGREAWDFNLIGLEGWLATEEPGIPPLPLEQWHAQGRYRPEAGTLTISQYAMQAGGGLVQLAGDVVTDGSSPVVNLEGRIGPMPIRAFKAMWPRGLAPATRQWVSQSIPEGRIAGATFRWANSPRSTPGTEPRHGSLTLEASDLLLRPMPGLPTLAIPRALVRLEGTSVEISVPDATIALAERREIALKAGRFTAVDIYSERPVGQISFRGQGPAPGVLEVLEADVFGIGRMAGLERERIEGKVDGQITITLPLNASIAPADLRVEGRARLTDGRARQLIAGRDAQAATVVFDVSDRSIDARGDMLISGVPVKVAWLHIRDAPPDRQPPLRLTATLDASDRAQLGIDASHLVQGEVPVEITVAQSQDHDAQIHVRADLTRAELGLEAIAWRKPPGRSATLQFDLMQGPRGTTELHNFKIVGDDIAVSGWMGLDSENRLREFRLPDFSVSVVTRLDVQGHLRSDNVWDVKVRGQTYDGREFFRNLFSLDEGSDAAAAQRKDSRGLDLNAEIDTVLGHSDVSLRGFTMQLSNRGGKLTHLVARGTLDGGRVLDIGLQQGEPRKLTASTEDAGAAFRLVDFYPSLVGGRMRLEVNLDGRGAAEKTGVLRVERFRILGDSVFAEVLQYPDEPNKVMDFPPRQQRVVRQVFDFDWLRMPFSVGHGQFVMGDAEIRGPMLGATMRGKADFRARMVNIGGTYVPLQGINSAVGVIPGLGQLLAGPKGEGILGITFAIQGPMARPQVLVNPLSIVAPGIFREMFQLTPNQSVTPPRVAPTRPGASSPKTRSSSSPATTQPGRQAGEAEVLSGWSSETSVDETKAKRK